jgi:hypothetical protein
MSRDDCSRSWNLSAAAGEAPATQFVQHHRPFRRALLPSTAGQIAPMIHRLRKLVNFSRGSTRLLSSASPDKASSLLASFLQRTRFSKEDVHFLSSIIFSKYFGRTIVIGCGT